MKLTIKQMFENFWKIYTLNKSFKERDKERYYSVFLDGYGCALINIERKSQKEHLPNSEEKE